MVQVYKEPLYRRHYAGWVSEATFFRLLGFVASLVLAFTIAYSSGGFWLKVRHDVDQPSVHYTGDALLLLEGAAPGQEGLWSSSASLNAKYGANYVPAAVSASEVDLDFDGKPEVIEFSASVPSATAVHSVKLLLQLSYELRSAATVRLQGLAYLAAASPVPGGSLTVDGDLVLDQRGGLLTQGKLMDAYDMPLLGPGPMLEALDVAGLMKAYLDRNLTVRYSATAPLWRAGAPGQPFHFTVRLRVPAAQVLAYRPEVIEALKWGWVQFLATYVVLLWLLSGLEATVFRFRMLGTRVVADTRAPGVKF